MALVACGRPSPEIPSVEPPQTPTETPLLPTETPTSTSDPWLITYLPIPREVAQANYSQTIESQTITYSVSPSEVADFTDQYGNIYKVARWDKEQVGKIVATLEVLLLRKVGMEPVTSSDPYPIPAQLIPNEVKSYLNPSTQIQSDNPAIITQAQVLNQGLTKETDVVNSTLAWISQNIKWGCPSDTGNYAADAVWTLEKREGNCVNFANLTIALLRAQGIPARYVLGFKGYEDSNPGYLKPVNGSDWHVWAEAYYPEAGWVRYDAAYFDHPWHIPYGIQVKVMPDGTMEYSKWSSKSRVETDENWQLIGENNKVKLTYTITFSVKE